jgi:RNA polymerase sigma factor (TIGR02999 family)
VANEAITALLAAGGPDDPARVDELVPLVYDELRRMAHGLMRGEGDARTLDTTALVHEAYLKLAGDQQLPARGRRYFFGAAARAMRQVLVDEARRRGAERRGGGARPLALDGIDVASPATATDLVEIDRALERLAASYPRQARVVECRFFAGLSVDETAETLELSARTVKRDWALAEAWLYRELARAS